MRAGQSQSPAPGVDDTAQDVSTSEDQAGPSLDENATAANDGSLSRIDVEHLIRTLVGIQDGRSLAEALFEGLDNMNPGGRYDDKGLAEHTKALVSSPSIKLPKLHSKSDYKSWRSEVPLHFETRMLGAITYGTARYDEVEGLRRVK
ncbi:hypothetical protein PF005_g6558 [Phytophthora fragariae]|uniref:Uncharacterized protein n=1 Tax=Phytophthora fragariae TaxID=53985 RepID=A0A6A4EEM2_9STRA|nr:hypothetical protein PF003_g27500 [Phytophthora fragariae]KAE8942932.1 hypothetical protein PF009_g7336 [Phytophthora fragariae]KAE9022039.1 hypothetical protein PF011_g4664 [Phytophthora fragariae]KAE9124231.1 hypothetical protein PF007_g6797 [Phytophthora fragariae]KAE9124760.1 hypothetical protein PF010_g5900 [Phytophthora fragariae]